MEDTEKTKKQLLENVILAQNILDKIKVHPELTNIQDPRLSELRITKWNGHFVLDTLSEVASAYNVSYYNQIKDEKDVPEEVKKFFLDAVGYQFFDKN
jgi:hypothetical protein